MLYNMYRELRKEIAYQRISYKVLANRMGTKESNVKNMMHKLKQLEEHGDVFTAFHVNFYLKAAKSLNCKVLFTLIPQTSLLEDELAKEKRELENEMAPYFQSEIQEREFGPYASAEKALSLRTNKGHIYKGSRGE